MTRRLRRHLITLSTVSLLVLWSGAPAFAAPPRTLTFEDRIIAQEAIERVYYSHQLGATKSFEEAVPREVLEKKVRTYLKELVALEEFWRTPITAEALHSELTRLARNTRFPDRLLEIYHALGDDPFLVEECFARPVLVDRLTRNFFAFDAGIHAAARAGAEDLHQRLAEGTVDFWEPDPRRTVTDLHRATGGASPPRYREEASLGTAN